MQGPLMIQGTMSGAGKSLICAGLCRILKNQGVRVAPFKAQNMALNSAVTKEGLEIGRAQAMQAECCKLKPSVLMNPVLLKPTSDKKSQVIVNGKVFGQMDAKEYYKWKKNLIPYVTESYEKISSMYDVIIIEGAGSPAEINLRDNDFVNMGMAAIAKSPVILVGDIDRGGVFAQLAGTISLLTSEEQKLIHGLIINKFRGDISILQSGISMIEKITGKNVIGTLPYFSLNIDDEDSLSLPVENSALNLAEEGKGKVDIAIIGLPHISNFTDFDIFYQTGGALIRYVRSVATLGRPDMIIIPGSKNTLADLAWLKASGLFAMIKSYANAGGILVGICGGFQMLGKEISDEACLEGGGKAEGLNLLPFTTDFKAEKKLSLSSGTFSSMQGFFSCLETLSYSGYEIHQGESEGNVLFSKENIFGTYIHGIFDEENIAAIIVENIAKQKKIETGPLCRMSRHSLKEVAYDKLAGILEQNIDMKKIYSLLGAR